MQPIIPILLAGGSGERLWPLSTETHPKPFLRFGGDAHSLFQHTVERVADRSRFTAPLIVCNQAHVALVRDQLTTLGIADATILAEPVARNTAPAVALAALYSEWSCGMSPILVLPTDHYIADEAAFHIAVAEARPAVENGYLVTFATPPTRAESDYGYLQLGELVKADCPVHRLERFVEKPDTATARTYMADPAYGWNSGIVFASNTTLLAEYAEHAAPMLALCRESLKKAVTDTHLCIPDLELWAQCPFISIDYALMEKTSRGAALPVQMGWHDLGSWSALAEHLPGDADGNRFHGPVFAEATTQCYVHSDGPIIATVGVRDLAIVASNHAVLVGAPSQMSALKALLSRIQTSTTPRISHRPWGWFEPIENGACYQVKRLHVKPGGTLSLQSHAHRSEHWVVIAGRATVTDGEGVRLLEPNQSTYIPAGTIHRLENREASELIVIEVQTGKYLGEDDITRYEDDYRRIPT